MNKYEISVWEDYPDKTEQNIPFLNERKICTIGSNTMTSSARAREPKMVENINGTHTFTFKMFYNYIDEYTGEKYANPFIPYLINERKIKVFWNEDWYDLIIKNIDEDSNSNSVTYTCKDLFITELSKNGYNIELTSDLQNNSGTANELASMVLDGSGWQFDSEGSTKIYQYKEEVVYEVTLSNDLSVNKITLDREEEIINLARGQNVLIFKSSIDQIPNNANNFDAQIHLLYTDNSEDFYTDANEMLVNNGIEGYFKGKATALASNTRSFRVEKDNINIFEVTDNDFSIRYRGKRIIKSQKTVYDKIFERYVNVYKDSSNTIIYGFSSLEFTSPLNVVNLIANSSDFTGISGWLGQNLTWTVYPELGNTQLSNYNSKGYLRLNNGVYYNSGLTANLAYFTPSQSDLKVGEIGGFNKGEKYVFRIKAKTVGSNNTVGNYITSHNSFSLDVKQFNPNDKLTPIGNSYFSLINTATDSNWLEYTYECNTSCAPKQMEVLGLYITSNTACWVEDIQFFKYAVGVENGVEKRINPGDAYLQSVSQQVYKYYLPGQAVSAPEEVVFLYKGEEDQSSIYFPQFTYEKITTIEAKASNRFNILQSIAENFECWVQFIIEHDSQGNILLDDQTGLPQKRVRLVESIGEDLGWSFTYGIDLKNIKRKVVSDSIATKVIILSNNNEFGKNGFCTIARSELNYPKETFILNFDYYINQGLLNRRELELDLYSSSNNYIGYFYNLNRLNDQYDVVSSSLSQLNMDLLRQQSEADTLQKQLDSTISEKEARESDILQLSGSSTLEQAKAYIINHEDNTQIQSLTNTIGQLNTDISLINNQLSVLTNSINTLTSEINSLSSQQESLIQNLKELHESFFQKYSRYIQEGTWQDENYIDDNQYYLDALQVAYTSSRPQIQYDINVVRLNYLEDYSSKKFKVGDLCYIQDKEFFNYITEDGSPYKLKIVINEITSYFDTPEKDVIKVQNYKTQFDDLFQRIVATTQSLQYAQGSYAKAASVINQDKTLNFNLLQETFDYNASLVLNASNQDVTWGPDGITIRDNLNSASQLRIMSGGLFVTNDGGLTWKNAVRGDGISTDVLTAGRINTGEIFILNDDYPTFRWDSNGITAYSWDNNGAHFNKFVRYDQYGFYGYEGLADFIPDDIDDVTNNATFGLTWNGFFMKSSSGNGSVIINSNDSEGKVIKSTKNGQETFWLKNTGDASFRGTVYATSLVLGDDVTIPANAIDGNIPIDDQDIINILQENGYVDADALSNELSDYATKNDLNGYATTSALSTVDAKFSNYVMTTTANGKYIIVNAAYSNGTHTENATTANGGYVFKSDGALWAENAFINGTIVANSGLIGGWSINPPQTTTIDGKTYPKINNFPTGSLYYTNSNNQIGVSGTIFLIPSGDLQTATTIAGSPSPKKDWRLTIGSNFGVDKDGNVYAINGHFSGNITASSGDIGGWHIAIGEKETWPARNIDNNTIIGSDTMKPNRKYTYLIRVKDTSARNKWYGKNAENTSVWLDGQGTLTTPSGIVLTYNSYELNTNYRAIDLTYTTFSSNTTFVLAFSFTSGDVASRTIKVQQTSDSTDTENGIPATKGFSIEKNYWDRFVPEGALYAPDYLSEQNVAGNSGELFGWYPNNNFASGTGSNASTDEKFKMVPWRGIYLSPVNNNKAHIKIPGSAATDGSNLKDDWRVIIGNNFGIDSAGTLYASNGHFSGNINSGTINANQVVFEATNQDGKGGGFRCATGGDGNGNTYGAMMYGWPTNGDIANVNYYFIATNAGVRMTATSNSEIFCTATEARIKSTNVYVNGKSFVTNTGAFTGSDRNKKYDISYNFDKYKDFYKELKPSYFKLKDGTSNRYHVGFIAQDVEEALLNNGLTTQDFAGFGILKPENESEYQALRYEEFISLNTYMIQKLMKQIEDLQQEIQNLKQ